MKKLVLLIALLFPSAVMAQQGLPEGLEGRNVPIPMVCGDTRDLYQALGKTHSEVPVVIAFSERDTAVVWFTNADRTTMSVVIDTPEGESCMIYSTRCREGDCHLTPGEVVEQAEEILKGPKVSL